MRCFAFGCSFTHWFYWPTWADFIGINFDEYYNLGMPGSSNRMVHNRLIEANEFYKFNKNDLVLIGITNFGRLNWLEEINGDPSWCCHGGPQNWPSTEKTKFLKNHFWKQNYGIYDTWLMIVNSVQLFDTLGIKNRFVMSLDNRHFLHNEILDLSSKEISMSKKIFQHCVTNQSLQEFSSIEDGHPDPIEHYHYAEQYLKDLITDKSKLYLDEVCKNIDFTCTGEQAEIFGRLKAKYISPRNRIELPLYGNYH